MHLELQSRKKLAQRFVISKQLLFVALLFVAALGIRLYRINEPPLDFHTVRQYHSLLIARGYYFATLETVPKWMREVAKVSMERQGMWEPHIIEFVASVAYRIVKGEHFWIPRLLSVIFWLTGGAFLYLIAKGNNIPEAAIFSTAFYLFLPFGVQASRSFQPEPLLIMGSLVSIFAIFQYYEKPSIPRLLFASIVSALAILIKFVGLFWILSAFVFMGVCRKNLRRFIINPESVVFIMISLLPATLFYSYQIFISKSLVGVAHGDILPQLLFTLSFWKGWLHQISEVVGYSAFIVGLLGIFLFSYGCSKSLIIGLWFGYFVFGLVFTYTIHTHDYWNLPIVPVVALSAGPVAALVYNRLIQLCTQWPSRAAVWSVLLLAVLLSLGIAQARLLNPGFERKVRTAVEIGELVNHRTNNIYLASDYGLSLEYHGELSGVPWPLLSDLEWERLARMPVFEAGERFERDFAADQPDYFIVMDMYEYEQQADLKGFLTQNYSVLAQNDNYLIFDLQGR